MRFTMRRAGKRRVVVPVALTALFSAFALAGPPLLLPHSASSASAEQPRPASLPADSHSKNSFDIIDATWTTAHIRQKGLNWNPKDTGLVVTYLAPVGRNPGTEGDWVGIYERGKLDKEHRKDWDYVCPNEHNRCMSYGAAAVPAGNDGLRSAATYTVAYWKGGTSESSGAPVATINYVVPW
ncbi:hypothetical protein ACMA1D_00630 [Streptomyces sp. 796.1]|uniref:hypothetical protein n=1 Tax=Streptomyces sp. 796.1 TaxID=3163029 RepID=UPI0039C96EE9